MQLRTELRCTVVRITGLRFAHIIITYKIPYHMLIVGVRNDLRPSHTLHLEESETSGTRIFNILLTFCILFCPYA